MNPLKPRVEPLILKKNKFKRAQLKAISETHNIYKTLNQYCQKSLDVLIDVIRRDSYNQNEILKTWKRRSIESNFNFVTEIRLNKLFPVLFDKLKVIKIDVPLELRFSALQAKRSKPESDGVHDSTLQPRAMESSDPGSSSFSGANSSGSSGPGYPEFQQPERAGQSGNPEPQFPSGSGISEQSCQSLLSTNMFGVQPQLQFRAAQHQAGAVGVGRDGSSQPRVQKVIEHQNRACDSSPQPSTSCSSTVQPSTGAKGARDVMWSPSTVGVSVASGAGRGRALWRDSPRRSPRVTSSCPPDRYAAEPRPERKIGANKAIKGRRATGKRKAKELPGKGQKRGKKEKVGNEGAQVEDGATEYELGGTREDHQATHAAHSVHSPAAQAGETTDGNKHEDFCPGKQGSGGGKPDSSVGDTSFAIRAVLENNSATYNARVSIVIHNENNTHTVLTTNYNNLRFHQQKPPPIPPQQQFLPVSTPTYTDSFLFPKPQQNNAQPMETSSIYPNTHTDSHPTQEDNEIDRILNANLAPTDLLSENRDNPFGALDFQNLLESNWELDEFNLQDENSDLATIQTPTPIQTPAPLSSDGLHTPEAIDDRLPQFFQDNREACADLLASTASLRPEF